MANNNKEIDAIEKSINRIREKRAAYIKHVHDERRKQAADILADAGADVPVSVSGELGLDVLNNIEILFNEPISNLKERQRQVINADKAQQVKDSSAIIEKTTSKIDALTSELEAEKNKLAGILAENRNIENNLAYRGGEKGAIHYKRVAPLIYDSRVNAPAKASHLSYITNY